MSAHVHTRTLSSPGSRARVGIKRRVRIGSTRDPDISTYAETMKTPPEQKSEKKGKKKKL